MSYLICNKYILDSLDSENEEKRDLDVKDKKKKDKLPNEYVLSFKRYYSMI